MIRLENISKQYSSGKELIFALKDINLTLPDKGMVFIVGKSGSGKSTLLNIIGAIDESTSGKLFFNQVLITRENKNQYVYDHISFIFQEHNLINDLTTKSNIAFTKSMLEKDSTIVSDILKSIDLIDMEDRQPKAMSTGQKQRVSIARALHKNSSIILADEATGSLDSENSIEVMKILQTLSKEKLVVCVSHDDSLAKEFSDRTIRLKDGLIVADSNSTIEIASASEEADAFLPKAHYLSLGQMSTLAVNNIKRKPFRVFFTLLLSALSLSFFALMSSFSNYDYIKTLNQSLFAEGSNYIQISQRTVKESNDEVFEFDDGFSNEDISKLQETIDSNSLLYASNLIKGDIDDYMFYDYSGIYNSRITTGIAIDEDIAKSLNLQLLEGRYPINREEVLISKHIYEMLSETGLKDSNNMLIDVISYDDVIGYELEFDDSSYIIVGIIDTNFNDAMYEPLKNTNETDTFYSNYLSEQLSQENKTGLQNNVFVHPSVISDTVNELSSPYIDLSHQGSYIELYYSYPKDELLDGKSLSYTSVSWYCKNELEGAIYKNASYTYNDLCTSENDIVIPASSIRHTITHNSLNILEYYEQRTRELALDFALHHFDEIKDTFDVIPLKDDTYYDYYNYILDTSRDSNILNEYHTDMELDYFKEEAFKEAVTLYLPYLDGSIIYLDNNASIINQDVMVQGLVNDLDKDYSSTIYTSTSLGESIKSITDSPITKIIVTEEQKEEVMSFVSGQLTLSNHSQIIVESSTAFFLLYFSDYITSLSSIAFVIAVIMIIVLGILLFNLISSSIIDRQYEIGVIKAIGISNKGVTLLFLVESIIISLINSAFAIVIFIISSVYANNIINLTNMNHIVFFPVTLSSILLIFAISMLITVISTMIPILSVSKKSISELMRRNT